MIAPLEKRKLLVVDDEPLVRQTLQYCLEDDYEITCVSSGEEALEASRKEDFPVVILDLCMEGLSGLETLKRLKKIRESQNVIILTAFQSMESAITALNSGAFNYLTKPFERSTLRQVIARGFEVYDQQIYRNRDLQRRLMSVHDTFFSLLCHEFNTPLNVILGFSEMLADSVRDREQKSWADEVRKSGHHLHDVLMEIVDYIGVSNLADAGQEKNFQLGEIFEEIARQHREREVEVRYLRSPVLDWTLRGPSHSVEVLTRKLVRMASHQSSEIFLKTGIESVEEGARVQLRLEVTGTGIFRGAMGGREIEQLFEPYESLVKDDSGNRAHLGLELATCRKIAEYARGSVNGVFARNGELGFVAELSLKVLTGDS